MSESTTYIYWREPDPERASTAEQLEWLLLTTPGAKVVIDLDGYRRSHALTPEDAWMADESGVAREVALDAEAELRAVRARMGVSDGRP